MKKKIPLYMLAQVPFNTTDGVELNAPVASIMNDITNSLIAFRNLSELMVLKDIIRKKTKFLEIGSGRGYLIHSLLETGGKGEYRGIEPIKAEADLAKGVVRTCIRNTTLEKARYNKNYFDYMYSYHVFEHLINPELMMTKAQEWLKPGGKLIISCPNVDGYIPQKDLNSWRCSILPHRWLPGLSVMLDLLERNNFEIEKYFTYGGYPHPRNLFKDIANWYIKKRDRGDIMCVMASKNNKRRSI